MVNLDWINRGQIFCEMFEGSSSVQGFLSEQTVSFDSQTL